MSNTPNIRFKGFTIPWEQCKVSDLLEERNEQAPESEEYPLMAFIANEGVAPKGERYDRGALVKDAENKLYKKTEYGDFIYSSNNLETGSIGLNNYGNASISPVYSIFKPTGIADSDFIGKRFVRKDFINAMVKWRQGVVYGQWKIHESDFLKIEVAVPSLEEQRKIGAYLSEIDNLITLHQRKCDAMTELKKYMLQKMFPKNGERFPEIRFSGFTDPWEQRKLGDRMYIKSRIGWQALTKKEYLESGDYYLITGTDIDEDTHTVDLSRCYYVSKERYDMDNKIQVHEGDIIVTKDGTIGKVAMVTGLDKPATLNSHLFVLRDMSGSLDNRFLLQILNSQIFTSFVESTKTGSTLTGLPQKTFVEFRFLAPKMDEQKQISRYFDNLDNLITLHQRKCEELKDIKKFMLQNTFPKKG